MLSEQEYDVLRSKGSEAPESSANDRHSPKQDHYACKAFGDPLYSYKRKFESGCGWPAFGKFFHCSIETREAYSLRMKQ
jgi:peptide-methionine (R)-S-oxide reductase